MLSRDSAISAVCAVATLTLYVYGLFHAATAVPTTVAVATFIPFAWQRLKHDVSWNTYFVSVTGFCAFVTLALSLFNLVAGAITVGLPYLRPLAAIALLLISAALILSYWWGKNRRSPAVIGSFLAALSAVLMSIYVLRPF